LVETGADVLHAAVEPTGMLRCGDESVPLVEASGVAVDGIDDQEARCCLFAGGDGLAERFGEG
jgi:hypothetical protein